MIRHTVVTICALVAAAAALRGQTSSGAGSLSCPEAITVVETAAPAGGWQPEAAKVERRFERVSIYNGNPGKDEYDLAPDDQKQDGKKVVQTWKLKGYRSMNVFLRCRYRGTSVSLYRDVPASVEECTLSFETDGAGKIAGKPVAVCR